MRFIFKMILIAAFGYLAELFLPWWSVVLVAFLVGFWLPNKGITAFLAGFLGVGLLWMIYAWLIDLESSSILSERLSGIFSMNSGVMMIIITGLVGGLTGAFAALSGSQFRRIFIKDAPKRGYYS
ncbi:MAG: hypothetical protein ACLFUB_02220 [Cyclobacteriaceae bacterium]